MKKSLNRRSKTNVSDDLLLTPGCRGARKMKKTTEGKRREIINALTSGKYSSLSAVAKACHSTVKTVSEVRAGCGVSIDLETARQREELAELKLKYVAALGELSDVREQIGIIETCSNIVPINFSINPNPKRNDAVPVLVLSDWHLDEKVDANAIRDSEGYNVEIAKRRVQSLLEGANQIIQILHRDSNINQLVVALLGDFMSCWIHDELVETNGMTPPEAVLTALNMLTGVLENLLANCGVDKIIVVEATGNHGRITKKPQAKNRVKKNYEWIIYHLLAKHFEDKGETRIQFKPPTGYFNWLNILGRPVRFHHGDAVHYQGGVGGVHIPLRKAIAQWNKKNAAVLDVMGHWHAREMSRDYVINGCLIGYNEFAEQIKADFETARQSIFLLHSRFGKTGEYPIVVEDENWELIGK